MSLATLEFPAPKTVRTHWAPILLSPVLGSPEKFVIGIAAIDENGGHIEIANALDRLKCLYGSAAATAIFAAETALESLKSDVSSRGIEALVEAAPTFSGISVGQVAEGEGLSARHLARSWMSALSSLYLTETLPDIILDYELEELVSAATAPERTAADRLPVMVFDYVLEKRPNLDRFFSMQIREHNNRRKRNKAHEVHIDFAGSKLVANFATLTATRAASVDRIKRKLFDLMQDRDRERTAFVGRSHEMLVYHPSKSDPTVSERQLEAIDEALENLKVQSEREEIKFSPMTEVVEIGERVLTSEAA